MGAEQTYIAFLRSVNVGGRKVEMARLREVLTGLGLEGVRTYIASGNAFFTSPEIDHARLVEHIETGLTEAFGFAIPTMLRTVPELRAELDACPFAGKQPASDERFVLVFASSPLPTEELPLRSRKGDWEIVDALDATAYVRCHLVNNRSVNPASAVEKNYGVRATARFFHTTEKILAAARNS